MQGTSLSRLRSVEAGAGSATRSLSLLGSSGAASLTKVQSGFSGLLGLLSRVSIALGGIGFAAVGTGAIRLAANLEQATIAFTTMLGSGEKAKSFLDDLASFAASTPFEFTGLQQSSRLLLAFGFEAQNILPIMGRVGDAVAALGGGEAEINRVVRALGQIQAKGKVSAEELMQIAELGIPAYEILGQKLNLTQKQLGDIGNAGIDSATAITAILEGLGERFGGAMAAQSQTLNGLFSTLRDNVTLTLTDLGTRAVEALNLKGVVRGFIEFTGNIRTALEQGGITGLLGQYKDQLGLIAATIAGPLVAALAGLALPLLGPLAAFAALAAAGATLYTAWKNNFLGLGDYLNGFWGGVRDGITGVIASINSSYGSLDNYKARWGEAFALVGQKANEWYMGVRQSVSNSLDALREGNPKAASLLSGLGEMFGKTVQAIGNAFVQLPNYIIAVINSAAQLGVSLREIFGAQGIGLILNGFASLLYGYIVEPFQNLVEPVAESAAKVGQVVSNWASKVATFFKPFTDFLKSIGRSIGDAFGTVASTTVSSLTDELKAGIEQSTTTLATFTEQSYAVGNGINHIGDGWSTIKHAAEDAAGSVVTELENIQANSQQAADAGSNLADANTDVADTANDAAQGAINLASGTGQTADAADAAADAEKRLKAAVEARTKDATVWTTRLNDEVVTGSKTAAEAAELILPVYDRVKANVRAMLESGTYDGEEYLVAKGRLEILEKALTTFLGTPKDVTVDVKVNYDNSVEAAKDFVAAQQEAANSAAPYDADGTDALSESLAEAVKQSGYMTQAQQEANLALRATGSSAESLSGTLVGLNDKSRVAGQYFQDGADGANEFSTALAELNAKGAAAADTSGPNDFSTSLGDLNTISQYALAQDRAAEATAKITKATEDANRAVKDEGDLVGQTKQELGGYISELDNLIASLVALQQTNPELAHKLGVGPALLDLRDARREAEDMQESLESLSQTKGGLRALGSALEGLAGLAGGGTFAGMLAGLGAGANAAAGEVANIKDGLDAIDKGDFSGGMQSILGAAQVVLGAIKAGFEQVLGEDIPAAANVAFTAVDGALGGAAAGAVFGPWGAVIGGVVGFIGGLISGVTAEQKKWTEEARRTGEAVGEAATALAGRQNSAQQTELDTARVNFEANAPDKKGAKYYRDQRGLNNRQALIDEGNANSTSNEFYNTEDDKLKDVTQTPEVVRKRTQLRNNLDAEVNAHTRRYQADLQKNNADYTRGINDAKEQGKGGGSTYKAPEEEKAVAGSVGDYNDRIQDLRDAQNNATSAGEYSRIEQRIKQFQAKIDDITGKGTTNAIKGSLDWYDTEIKKLQDKQGKATNPGQYADLQKQIDVFTKQMDKIKGLGATDVAGSIAYYSKILEEKRKAFESTGNDANRASLGAEIEQLQTTIGELQKAGQATESLLDTIREGYKVGSEDFAGTMQDALHAADYETFTDNFQDALKKKITDAIIQGQVDAEAYQGLSDMVAGALSDGTVTQGELDGIQGEADKLAKSQQATFDLLDDLTLFGDTLSETAGGMSELNSELTNVPSGLKLARMRYALADTVTPEAPSMSVPAALPVSTPGAVDMSGYRLSAPSQPNAVSVSDPSSMMPDIGRLSASLPDTTLSAQGGSLDFSGRLESVMRDLAKNTGVQITDAKFYGVTDVAKLHSELESYRKFSSGRQSGSTASR